MSEKIVEKVDVGQRNKFDVDEQLESRFNISHFKRSFKYVKKHRKSLILALSFSILASVMSLMFPYFA